MPASVTAMFHRHGGSVTRVTKIGHATTRGVARWFFIGDVAWRDGGQSTAREIAPDMLLHDDTPGSREAVLELMARLHAYLAEHGTWHEPKKVRGGFVTHWTPHKKAHAVEVPS
jgi:hypothetical protein